MAPLYPLISQLGIAPPRPPLVAHFSRWTLLSPHSLSWPTAHSPAARNCGELVRRGPYRSVRLYIVFMICDPPRPPPPPPNPPPPPPNSATLILWITLRSIRSVAC